MTEHRLPVKQLAILSICRFAEPIALTSVFPYVPELMESFGIPKNDIARWAGISSSAFSLCQGFTGLLWGAASDRYGRKPIILFGLANTMWSMLLWGFSLNLPMALAARAIGGLSNGYVGILRTTVAELCPWKELQPRAFSVMPLVWTVGATFGPTLGGALANPLGVDPRKPKGTAFLERFPYCLPNIVAAALFTFGISVGWLFLQETLESKKHAPDLGLRTGARLTAFVRKVLHLPTKKQNSSPEHEPLLGQLKAIDSETMSQHDAAHEIIPEKAPRYRDVLTYQTSLNLIVYTLLAMYLQAYDQLLPVFMHHPVQLADDPTVSLPLKFAGGFGIESRRIGIIFTVFAISCTVCQFLLFPPIARYLGVVRCLRIAFLIFPFVFFVTPFLSLISDPVMREIAMVMLLMVRGLAGTFSFTTSTIMLTNSALSLRVLGTVNGLATSFSSFGRALGPTLGGGLFTWGVKRGYVIVPFWTMSAIALAASIPTFWLVEGKGFGGDEDINDLENTIETEEEVVENDARVPPTAWQQDDAAFSESEFGDFGDPPNILSLTTTRSSVAMASDDEDNASVSVGQGQSMNPLEAARSHSQTRRRKIVRRTSSIPIGMGKGFRRYSSNLGSTGIGGGGASWGGA
ncbi:major facilitator superfamily domain-containing protein [Alternaria rosae]|uniref:major facilitator superfamily domain-containing protein n=1 Tax=Alternaria rosae TaxID=1187941 RepID=UPI001E8ED40C|nr:major facilitator superfamily domain-containing protein [Alternaria rosae]KAH6882583.1 major facilitator superfamily domain-containing protein [Alternaria rosae]